MNGSDAVESVSLKYAVVGAEDKPPFFQVLADALCEVHGINRDSARPIVIMA